MSNDVFHGIRAASAVDALGIAAANGKLREMNLLLQDGIAIDARATYSGRNPLQSAALQGQTRALEILLAAGAEVNATDVDEMTALMNACHVGKVKGSKAALQLIAAGADVRFIRRADSMTALKFAVQDCTPEVIQTLIDRGAEVDGPADTKQTALMIAARANNVEAIRVLVKNGADLSLRCGIPWADGRTAEGLAELEKKKAALGALREARQAASNKAQPNAAPDPAEASSVVPRRRLCRMAATNLIGLIDVTFDYFKSLGSWHKDPTGVGAVREVRDRMVRDLEAPGGTPSPAELTELCREWRGLRVEVAGEATYPPDLFIESVCQVIEIS